MLHGCTYSLKVVLVAHARLVDLLHLFLKLQRLLQVELIVGMCTPAIAPLWEHTAATTHRGGGGGEHHYNDWKAAGCSSCTLQSRLLLVRLGKQAADC